MQDYLLTVIMDLIVLIRTNEIEAAAEKVAQARKEQSEIDYRERKKAVTQINIELQKMKRQRDLLRQAVHALPEKDRLFAEQQIEAVVDKLYSDEMAELRRIKRKLSRPEK